MRVSNFWTAGGAMITMTLLAIATPTDAQPLPGVVVHVRYTGNPTLATLQIFEKAKEQAAEIYAGIPVSLIWADGSSVATHIGGLSLMVAVLSDIQTDRFLKDNRQVRKRVLGAAPVGSGRVYVFWDRVLRRARKDEILPHRVLGLVLAHEMGHLLLPAQGHSGTGLMRRSLNYQSPELPSFTEAEAESIRMLLTRDHATAAVD